MEHKLFRRILIGILLQLVVAQQTLSIELFKYVNEDGVTVLDSRIPARYVRTGYTILSSDGRVLEVVDRALTDEEIVERDRLAAIEAKKQQELEAKEAADTYLMQLYSIPEDVIQARNSKLASMNGFVNSARTNLQRVVVRKRQLESIAADNERFGGTISREDIDRIESAAEQIEQMKQKIVAKLQEIEQAKQQFARDLIRVKELSGKSRAANSRQ